MSYYGRKRTNSPTDHRFTLTMHVDLTMIGTEDREDGQSFTHDIELIATVINRSKKNLFFGCVARLAEPFMRSYHIRAGSNIRTKLQVVGNGIKLKGATNGIYIIPPFVDAG